MERARIAYHTSKGYFILGNAEDALSSTILKKYLGKVDLIFTSPPFLLNRKKKYSNLNGQAYISWLKGFAPIFYEFLKPKGSIVIEIGNAWEPGKPVMNTLALEALIAFLRAGNLNLCQQFIWHNPARLPGPAQWVTVERIRVKDAYTHIWWMSPTDRPKADNRGILKNYSASMRTLLSSKKYNPGRRPSEHTIGKRSFLKDNRGSIPSNVLKLEQDSCGDESVASNLITIANTHATSDYLGYCRGHSIEPHPARMPIALAEFFIKFLTDPGDLVLDPFGGSNTTGAASEILSRRWISIEPNINYMEGSKGRFLNILNESGYQ